MAAFLAPRPITSNPSNPYGEPAAGAKPLQALPPSYPLADIQCTACSFRAQVKTVRGAPCGTIRGAGWDVVDKVTKAGHLLPALLVVWAPDNRVRVDFFPFISRASLEPYKLGPNAVRAGYRMFRYRLAGLPMVTLLDFEADHRTGPRARD